MGKIGEKKKMTLYAMLLCYCFFSFTLFGCVGVPCIAIGTLVMMDNDEHEHLQAISMPPTPFNAPLAPRSGAPHKN